MNQIEQIGYHAHDYGTVLICVSSAIVIEIEETENRKRAILLAALVGCAGVFVMGDFGLIQGGNI